MTDAMLDAAMEQTLRELIEEKPKPELVKLCARCGHSRTAHEPFCKTLCRKPGRGGDGWGLCFCPKFEPR